MAGTWGRANLHEGDEVVLSVMEHHSNLVPWQMLAAERGCVLKFAQLDEHESLDIDHLRSLVSPRTKLVAVAHVSNTLGCVNPVDEIVAAARSVGAAVLLDACQSVPHMPVDVQALDCDFLVASGHKMGGPSGIGFLYGKLDVLQARPRRPALARRYRYIPLRTVTATEPSYCRIRLRPRVSAPLHSPPLSTHHRLDPAPLQEMPPWQGGGEMIDDVFLDHSTFAPPPSRFEAGTPAITQARHGS